MSGNTITACGLSHVKIRDNNKVANVYNLMGCEFTHMNSGGSSKDKFAYVDRTLPDGQIQKTQNNSGLFSEGDNINGKKVSDDKPILNEQHNW